MNTSTSSTAADKASLLSYPPYVLYLLSRVLSTMAWQMMGVAVGWQVYEMTDSALSLGFVGLFQFIPVVLGTLVIGHVADHYDRKKVIAACQVGNAVAAAALAAGSMSGWLHVDIVFLVVMLSGAFRAFESPTLHTIAPSIMPPSILSRAIAAGNTAQQSAVIIGPAAGGLLYAFGPQAVYVTCVISYLMAGVLISLIKLERSATPKRKVTLETIFMGFNYVRTRPILLGALSLDLFAVFFAGVTALLPVFARDILAVGPGGMGLLRSAPAVGALAASAVLSSLPLTRHAGKTMLGAVAVYGLATLGFGLSTNIFLSIAALALVGAANAVSVVVRQSLVQTRTPNDMLGRVMAVSAMFTSGTNSIGQLESGALAALIGTQPTVLLGGVAAVIVALSWGKLFPQLAAVHSVVPEEIS
jgi:MFS family permease